MYKHSHHWRWSVVISGHDLVWCVFIIVPCTLIILLALYFWTSATEDAAGKHLNYSASLLSIRKSVDYHVAMTSNSIKSETLSLWKVWAHNVSGCTRLPYTLVCSHSHKHIHSYKSLSSLNAILLAVHCWPHSKICWPDFGNHLYRQMAVSWLEHY